MAILCRHFVHYWLNETKQSFDIYFHYVYMYIVLFCTFSLKQRKSAIPLEGVWQNRVITQTQKAIKGLLQCTLFKITKFLLIVFFDYINTPLQPCQVKHAHYNFLTSSGSNIKYMYFCFKFCLYYILVLFVRNSNTILYTTLTVHHLHDILLRTPSNLAVNPWDIYRVLTLYQ